MIRRAACSCGQLHLTIEGEPTRIAMCHCLECQRRTGAVISNQARFRLEQVSFAGKTTAWTRTAESGNVMTYHFCPTCGSTVFWENEGFPGHVTVAIGNFADPNFQRRPLQCGKRRATPGSHYRPIHRQIAPKSRDRSLWGRSGEFAGLFATALAGGSDAIRGSDPIQNTRFLA